MDRLYEDVLAFEAALGVRFEWVLHVGDFGVWPDPRIEKATKKHDGVLIAKLDPNGSAADSGLQEGDLIASIGNVKVASPDEFEKQVTAARERGLKAVLLQVTNGSETRYVGLSIAAG